LCLSRQKVQGPDPPVMKGMGFVVVLCRKANLSPTKWCHIHIWRSRGKLFNFISVI